MTGERLYRNFLQLLLIGCTLGKPSRSMLLGGSNLMYVLSGQDLEHYSVFCMCKIDVLLFFARNPC